MRNEKNVLTKKSMYEEMRDEILAIRRKLQTKIFPNEKVHQRKKVKTEKKKYEIMRYEEMRNEITRNEKMHDENMRDEEMLTKKRPTKNCHTKEWPDTPTSLHNTYPEYDDCC